MRSRYTNQGPNNYDSKYDLRDTNKAYQDDAKAEWVGVIIFCIFLFAIAAMFGYLTVRSFF